MATIFLSCLGKEGLREMALMNLSKAEYAKKAVSRVRGCKPAFSGPTFNEFVLQVEGPPEEILKSLKEEKILAGLPLAKFYPELSRHLLVTVTEMMPRESIDLLAEGLKKVLK